MTSTEQLTMRPFRLPEDAAMLARMWRDSDDQWPGTFSGGVPITAEWLVERISKEQYREIMVWDAGDEIAGFCSLWDWPEEPGVTYIALLNVAPRFQKLGLGRRFLQHFVGRSVELGARRLDLHTWAGNLKAVPTYKKCGFFWMPGGGVHMYNFLPTILTLPLAQPFFAKHDWYTSLRRELTQAEDDERWEGMKVFTYRFEAGGDRLTVWIDRESRRVTAIDTGDLFAAAMASDQEPPEGLPAPIRWRIENRRAEPLHVTLIATGEGRLALDHRAHVAVAPGESAELSAEVGVPPAPGAQDSGPAAPAVRTLLVLGGETLELGTGLRPRPAVEVATEPEYITLAPGVPQVVALRLRSRLAGAATASIGLTPPAGLSAVAAPEPLELPAGGYAALQVTLLADEHGAYELPVSLSVDIGGQGLAPPAEPLSVFALGAGRVLGARVRRQLRLENETARLLIQERAGELVVTRPDGRWLAGEWLTPIPPLMPNEFGELRFDLSLEERGGQVVATATGHSREKPGLVLRRRVALGGGPVFTSQAELENQGVAALELQVRRWVSGDGAQADHVLPLAAGLTRAPQDLLPGRVGEELRRAESYAERWSAREHPDVTVGLAWSDDLETFDWGAELISRPYRVPPRSRAASRPLHWYVGDGGWQAVRRLALRLAGQEAGRVPVPAPFLSAHLDPPVVAPAGGPLQADLVVEHRLARPLDAEVALELPEGWRAEPATVHAHGVTILAPARARVAIEAPRAPGAYAGRARLRSAAQDLDLALPLLVLGDGGEVRVSEAEREGQRILTVDGGRVALDITPGLGGTVSGLREGGVNHLATPFPQIGTLGWMSPWYGGITPCVTPAEEPHFPPPTGREHFEAAPVDAPDRRGLPWRGVRQRAELENPDLRGVTLELDTLTLGGSPVVRLVLRLINGAAAPRRLHEAGWLVFPQPGGRRAATVWTPDWQQKHSEHMLWRRAGAWAAAEDPARGVTLALISPDREVGLIGMGVDGTHFKLLPPRPLLPAGGTLEIVAYLALAVSIAEARRWAALADLEG